MRQYKYDRGDWIALRVRGEYQLIGKVRDADSDSITVTDRKGTDHRFLPGDDPIARVHWRNRRWFIR